MAGSVQLGITILVASRNKILTSAITFAGFSGFGATACLCGRIRFNSVVPNRPTNQCEVSFVSFDFECAMPHQ